MSKTIIGFIAMGSLVLALFLLLATWVATNLNLAGKFFMTGAIIAAVFYLLAYLTHKEKVEDGLADPEAR